MAKAKAKGREAPARGPDVTAGLEAAATVARLAARFRLSPETLKGFGVSDRSDGRGVNIVYRGADGGELFRRRRTKVGATGNTYQPRGVPIRPYGLWRLHLQASNGYAVLVEGESDCWVGWEYNVPALGLPGADTAGCLRTEDFVSQVERVYVVVEPDEGGQTFLAGCRATLEMVRPDLPVVPLSLGPDKDLGEMHRRMGPDGFPAAWRHVLATARTSAARPPASPLPPQGPSPSEGIPAPAPPPAPPPRKRAANRAKKAPPAPGPRGRRAARRMGLAEGDLRIPSEGEGPCGASGAAPPPKPAPPTRPAPLPRPPAPLPPPGTNGTPFPTRPPSDGDADGPDYRPGNSRKPTYRMATALVARPTRWLVEPWIPAGKLCCVAGRTGCGKSTFGTWLMGQSKRVVVLPGREEVADEELLDRLNAAGVDLANVCVADGKDWIFPDHRRELADLVREVGADCVWIDPIETYIQTGGKNLGEYVRPALESLKGVAEQTSASVVYVKHPGKATANLLAGAAEWSQVPRVILELLRDTADRTRYILRPEKRSRGRYCPARYYHLDATGDGAPVWRWGDVVGDDVVETIRDVPDLLERRKIDRAVAMLSAMLAEGPVLSKTVTEHGKAEGLGDRVLQRAMERLGGDYHREHSGVEHRCYWYLPSVWKPT